MDAVNAGRSVLDMHMRTCRAHVRSLHLPGASLVPVWHAGAAFCDLCSVSGPARSFGALDAQYSLLRCASESPHAHAAAVSAMKRASLIYNQSAGGRGARNMVARGDQGAVQICPRSPDAPAARTPWRGARCCREYS
jgi:hypothetical protein